MPGVDTNVPLLVQVDGGHAVTVRNTGSQAIFYQDVSVGGGINQSIFDGQIPPFGSQSFISSQRLLSDNPGGQVDLGYDL